MAQSNVAIKIAAVGGEKVRAEFTAIGREGQRAMTGISNAGRSTGAGLQNVGYQVQDFAVQVAAGTSVSRALAQQLPQLLSGFGLLGVALGTAAAVFVPLIGSMMKTEDAAEGLSDQLSELEKATAAYHAAARNAAIPMYDLTAKFGGQAEAVRELYDAQFALAQLDLAGKQLALRASLAEAFSDIPNLLDQIEVLRTNLSHPLLTAEGQMQTQEALDVLMDSLGMSEEAALRIQAAFDGLKSADGPTVAAAAMAELRQAIIDAAGGYDGLTVEQSELIRRLVEAQEAAVLFGATDMSGGLRGANAEAQTLVERVNAALARAAEFTPGRLTRMLPDERGSQRTTNIGATDHFMAGQPWLDRKSGSGAMSEAQRQQNELMREAERLFDSTRTAAEKYDTELAKLNEMLAAGYINQDTYNRALEDLEEKTGKAGTAANRMRQNFEDAFVSMITGAESANEAISSLLAQMASSLAQAGISSLFDTTGLGGLIEGLFPNANGNAFDGGKVIPFANGGVVGGPTLFPMKGGIGLMGEAGPEAIMPLARGRDGRLGVRTEGAGRGVNVTVNISVDARGAVAGVAEEVAAAVRAQTPRIVQQTVAAVADAGRRGRQV